MLPWPSQHTHRSPCVKHRFPCFTTRTLHSHSAVPRSWVSHTPKSIRAGEAAPGLGAPAARDGHSRPPPSLAQATLPSALCPGITLAPPRSIRSQVTPCPRLLSSGKGDKTAPQSSWGRGMGATSLGACKKPPGHLPTHLGFELRVCPVPPVTPCPRHGAAGL